MSAVNTVVIPCGGAKLDTADKARRLYTGSMFQDALRTALQITDDQHVYILSAKHGLVSLDTELEPYDVKMGDAGSVSEATIREQAIQLGITGHVLELLPKAYHRALRNAIEDLEVQPEWAFATCRGIGDQKGVLAQLRRKALPRTADHTNIAKGGHQ